MWSCLWLHVSVVSYAIGFITLHKNDCVKTAEQVCILSMRLRYEWKKVTIGDKDEIQILIVS